MVFPHVRHRGVFDFLPPALLSRARGTAITSSGPGMRSEDDARGGVRQEGSFAIRVLGTYGSGRKEAK
ncbi:MAG: hypothetical protein QOH48_1560 [Actinomycetota bacterium]|jgi:hypothetical protein|nr:hypothetical protein [Actinomycetota bacterium]